MSYYKYFLVLITLVLMLTFSFAALNDNLVAYYDFNETSGALLDLENSYDVTNSNVTYSQTGIINNAYSYNGSSSYSQNGLPILTYNDFSIGLWFNTNDFSSGGTLFTQRNSSNDNSILELGLTAPSDVYYRHRSDTGTGITTLTSGETLSTNNWYYVTITFDKSTGEQKIYINGAYKNAVTYSGGTFTFNKSAFGGTWNLPSNQAVPNFVFFNGEIDEAGIWNRILTPTEITTLYNSGAGLTYPFIIESITADFDYTINKTNARIELTDTSTTLDATIGDWNWLVDGSLVSTDQNYNYSTTQNLDLNICLQIDSNDYVLHDMNCQSISTGDWYVWTTTNESTIHQAERTIDFNSTSSVTYATITSYEWLVNGSSEAITQNFTLTGITDNTDYNACIITTATGSDLATYTDTNCQITNSGDLTAPTTTFSSSQTALTTNNTLTLTCSDTNSGCKYINFSINGGDWNHYLIGDNPLTIIYSGVGDHNIQYYSSDNSDNNEAINTDTFSTYGYVHIKFYDEVDDSDFNNFDYTISPTLAGQTSATLTGNDLNFSLETATSDNYTFTFSKISYGTRYYINDINKFSVIDFNFLMLGSTQGTSLSYQVFQPDQLVEYANAKVNVYRPDKSNASIGTYYTNASGEMTVFTNVFDQNYLFNINDGESTYQPVALTIKFPLDEQTSTAIPTNYTIYISGAGSQDYNDVASDQVIYLLPNTIPSYKIKIQDVNENYFPRSYYKTYIGNPLTDEIQPYLISALTGLLTTIRSVSGSTNQPIPRVNIKIYKDLPSGRSLVEEIVTDNKGEALVYMLTGDQYYFEIYYNNLLLRTDTVLATSSIIYVRLDDLIYTQPVLGDLSAIINFYPVTQALSSADKKLIQTMTINDKNSTTSIENILIQIYNTDRNGIANSSYLVYSNNITYADENTITNRIDINADAQTIDGVWYDTNGLLQIKVTIITTDGNYISVFSYKPWNGFNPIYSVGFGSRSLFACESYYDADGNPNPLIPCPNQLFIALFISFILTAGISFGLKFVNPAGLGAMFMLILGIFAYLTFVPIILYSLMVAGMFVIVIVAKGRFN